MYIPFLGGADEVGASCTPINIDGYCILVDAGIRMNSDQPLPDFSMFDRCGMPDAVLLTHAHTDHTAALPVLHNMLSPDVKIYCTPPTKAITKVLLQDSARRMEREEQQDGAFRYTLEDVAAVLNRMELVPWLDPVEICPGVTARWIRAGHILGAAMIYIEGRNESILITGDVSVSKQLTIPSVDVPSWCKKPDVMIMESTYGDRQHEVARSEVEKRLVEGVAETIAAEGKVLISSFAVGRSQEVILTLKNAMERKQIPEFLVYVDGMVKDVKDIYSRFSDELRRELRHKVAHGEDLFYSDVIRPIRSDEERNRILSGEPCVIIASSGMLVGGRSSSYAKHLATNPKNLIALTGYQAKGTPGRELWDWVEAGRPPDWMWQLRKQESISVKCQVKKYSLSAHADSDQLMGLVQKIQPRKLFLVHGDAEARGDLFKRLGKTFPDIAVNLPQNGHSYTVRKREGIRGRKQLSIDRILGEVFAFVKEMRLNGPFRVRELAEIWFGTETLTPIVVKTFQWQLLQGSRFFNRSSGDLYYPR